jgi:hypothetical protein
LDQGSVLSPPIGGFPNPPNGGFSQLWGIPDDRATPAPDVLFNAARPPQTRTHSNNEINVTDDGGSESAVEYIDTETDSRDGVESGCSIDA